MKKRLLLYWGLTISCISQSYSVEINGIYYDLYSNGYQAEVVKSPDNNRYRGNIDIPSTITYEGTTYDVTIIGYGAFEQCKDVTSISIPNSVTEIGPRAFWGGVFKTMEIPNSVAYIGSLAFNNCYNLETITMGDGIKSIGESAFMNCSNLKKVIVKDLVTWCDILFESRTSNPLHYSNRLYNNENTEITELIIPDGIKTIRQFTFCSCKYISNIKFPNSVEVIEVNAFQNCDGLTNIIIPDGVKSLSGFSYCSNLTSVSIPNSVTDIANSAFSWCPALTSVVVPNSVTWIHGYAFIGCEGMKSITLGSGVKTLDNNAFYKCYALSDLYCYAENIPLTRDDPFDKSIIQKTTLHVPEESLEKYKTIEPWKSFKDIVALNSSGISNSPTYIVKVQSNGGQLTIEGVNNGEVIEVYSMDGTKRGFAISKNGVAQINTDLKSGNIGIVKINNKSVKVIIK